MQNFAIFAFSHFFRFSCFVFCFHFCWAISRLDFIGKRFLRSSYILELDARWALEPDFHGYFRVSVTYFFAFFSDLLVLNRWPSKLMTSQAVQGTWIRKSAYVRFRGEWVKLWAGWRSHKPLTLAWTPRCIDICCLLWINFESNDTTQDSLGITVKPCGITWRQSAVCSGLE